MSQAKPAVLHVVDTLTTGGAEIFVMRITQAMHEAGWPVSIFVCRPDRIERDQLARLAPGVPVVVAQIPLLSLLMKLDSLLFMLGLSFSCVRWWQVRRLVQHIRRTKVAVLHSHLLTADLVACGASIQTGVPFLSTMHGDYFRFANQGRYKASRIFDFAAHFKAVDQQIGHVVCISGPQMAQWKSLSAHVVPQGRISKIYNGYTPMTGSSANVDAALASVPADALLVGMVARGTADKGWDVMLKAFTALDDPRAWLVLVGDGPFLRQLRDGVTHPRIIFAGNVTNPANWAARFDVACLPTRYDAESLPNTVVEYLFEGKPVLATDVGEIAAMLRAGTPAEAGETLALASIDEMAAELARKLAALLQDPAHRAALAANAHDAALAFKMQHCLDQYFNLYQQLDEHA
ncbi:MAG: hypothetical protein RLZZ271_881 [Pseudomonadota bacterium]|jgi:glycosyltransferase involved in cell wall biosynthesis